MGNEESFRLIVLTPSPSLENGKAKEMMEITKQLDITTKETYHVWLEILENRFDQYREKLLKIGKFCTSIFSLKNGH